MSRPFIFVSAYRVKEGQLENYRKWTQGLVESVEAKEPRMLAFNLYVNDQGTEVAGVQVHPDASSMELHMQVVRQYIETAYGEFLDAPTMLLVCGEGDATRQMIRELTPTGFSPIEMPQHIGGFTRAAPVG
jgi:proteasome lid subunit RPN8/RPN11